MTTINTDEDAERNESIAALTALGLLQTDAEQWTDALLHEGDAQHVYSIASEWHEAGISNPTDAFRWMRNQYHSADAEPWHAKGYNALQVDYLLSMCIDYAVLQAVDSPRPVSTEQEGGKVWLRLLDSPAPARWVIRYVEAGHFTVESHAGLEEARGRYGTARLAEFLQALHPTQ